MKLLMLSGDRELAQGREGAFSEMLRHFAPHWERIDILTPSAGPARQVSERVFVHPSPHPLFLQPFYIWRQGKKLIQEHHHDLIVSHDFGLFYNGMGAWGLHKSTGVPYVSEIHHVEGHPFALTRREFIYRELARLYIRFAKKRVRAFRAVNQGEIPAFLRELEVPASQILILPSLYLDFEIFHPQPKCPKIYDLLFVGRFVSNKGIFTILEAVAQVKQTHPQVKLCLVGDGKLKGAVLAKIAERGLSENVTLIPRLETAQDMADLYNQTKILVCASTSEGGPRVTVEAMACGIPVISTPVGVMQDLMESGLNFLVFAWHAEPLAEKIRFLLDNPLERIQVGKNGEIAVQSFRAEHVISQYARAYQDLVKS